MVEEKKFCIYIHTNKSNNKKYIGITCQEHEKRWNNGYGYKGCPLFYNAIQKYGWDNFEHEIITCDLSKEDAENEEIKLILKYKTQNTEYGYNLSSGGNINDTLKKKIYQYDKDGNFIKEWKSINSIYEELNISNSNIIGSCKGKFGLIAGYQWRYDYAEIISPEKTKGEKITEKKNKKVYQYTYAGKYIKSFCSVSVAAESLNGSISNIASCCTGRFASAYGFRWSYIKHNKLSTIKTPIEKIKEKTSKKVFQYTLDGTYITSFSSVTLASEGTGLNLKNLSACCTGKRKTCGGFRWFYIFQGSNIDKLTYKKKNMKNVKHLGKSIDIYEDNKKIKTFTSIDDAIKFTSLSRFKITKSCKTGISYEKFTFKYVS